MIYFGYFSFSTIHLELKRHIRLYAPLVPLKTIPDLRSKSIPIFRPKRLKNHTLWGGTCLYSLHRGIHPPPGGGGEVEHTTKLVSQVEHTTKLFSQVEHTTKLFSQVEHTTKFFFQVEHTTRLFFQVEHTTKLFLESNTRANPKRNE